jgi:hypothetical protein
MSFRNFADYMETNEFREGIQEVLELANAETVVIMCAEAVYWRCHRSMIADFLKSEGVEVTHILDATHSRDHEWTFIEVKTRAHSALQRRKQSSYRQDLLREILRLRAHSLKQLPKKESSIVVLSTPLSPSRRKAVSKIALARSFTNRIFDRSNERILGLMIFAPFRGSVDSLPAWQYASALIPNPKLQQSDGLEKLAGVQL